MPEKSRLVEFNEYCLSAGESARTMLITLHNELRSGEHHRKAKALSSPAAGGRQNKRAAYMHFKSMWADRTRYGGNIALDLLWLLSALSKREGNENKHVMSKTLPDVLYRSWIVIMTCVMNIKSVPTYFFFFLNFATTATGSSAWEHSQRRCPLLLRRSAAACDD